MDEELDKYINKSISMDEELQPEVSEILLNLVPVIIESGVIKSKTGKYKYGSESVNRDSAIKRIIINISSILKSPNGYRVGLVNLTEDNLKKQSEIIKTQIATMLRNSACADEAEKLASDIVDVILTSWFLVACLPGESGWGENWV